MNRPSAEPAEADLVERLRKSCSDLLSLVGCGKRPHRGHILFSPVRIDGREMTTDGMGLAPVAMLPAWQRQGISTPARSNRHKDAHRPGLFLIIVLAIRNTILASIFERASLHGIRSQWQGVPDEAFMIMILYEAAMAGVLGMGQLRERIR